MTYDKNNMQKCHFGQRKAVYGGRKTTKKKKMQTVASETRISPTAQK